MILFEHRDLSIPELEWKIQALKCVVRKQRQKLCNISYEGVELKSFTSSTITYIFGEAYYKFGHDEFSNIYYYVKENCGLETQLIAEKIKRILISMNGVHVCLELSKEKLKVMYERSDF